MRQRTMTVGQIVKTYEELENRVHITEKASVEAESKLGFDSLAYELIKGAHVSAVEELDNFAKVTFKEV
ncbi:hypothetical protein CPT_Moonbeam171 [Bacillus phage Moonbeam]|uniref:Uncharacterized protein n=1 Tax=Bacillus phage Moonbeam TaxID=1540091 RepID=A0A0A0RPM7_9CAUD|nr:hypothetical protein CPT_Moonbeam171 [Bacillus phage Moonbeam]AIW03569.1 hypothetical protein CPT_Moonbeam171 [Bacillus phage Moonbeam]